MSKKGSAKRKIKKMRAAQMNRQDTYSNEEMGKAFHGLRSSNAAQPHVPSPKKGTRSVKNRSAILEY